MHYSLDIFMSSEYAQCKGYLIKAVAIFMIILNT